MSSLRPIDYLMGVGVAFTWGMGIVVAKVAIGEQFPPILLMALRFAVTALIMVWFVKPPVGSIIRIFGIAVISAAIQYSLTFTGLKDLDASVAALVVQLEVPFLVLLGALLLNEQPGLRKWLGIGVAFIGVAMIASQFAGHDPMRGNSWFAMGLVVGGAFTWALGQVMVRSLKGISGLTMMTWVSVCATPQLFFMSFMFEDGQVEAVRSAELEVWGSVFYLGVIMNVVGYGIWYTLVHRHPVSRVGPFLLLLPVFSVIGGVVFRGEELGLITWVGGAVVLVGVAAIVFERGVEEDEAEVLREPDRAPPLDQRSYIWSDGSRYQGEWLNGRIHGYGVMRWSKHTPWPGDRYEGQWANGVPEGYGIYIYGDGRQVEGTWVSGLISSYNRH